MEDLRTEKYKLFAYLLLVKKVRSNSMFYSHDRKYRFVTSLGIKISPTTFKKYWDMAVSEGFVVKMGEHFQIISIEEIALKLGLNDFVTVNKQKRKAGTKKFLITKGFKEDLRKLSADYDTSSFKGMYDAVLSLAHLYNFQKQSFHIKELKATADDCRSLQDDVNVTGADSRNKLSLKKVKRIMKKAEKDGVSTKVYSRRVSKKVEKDGFIKYGNRFFGQKLGISPSKSSKVLKGLSERKFVFQEKNTVNHGAIPCGMSYEQARAYFKPLKGSVIYTNRKNELIEVRGTKISPLTKFKNLEVTSYTKISLFP